MCVYIYTYIYTLYVYICIYILYIYIIYIYYMCIIVYMYRTRNDVSQVFFDGEGAERSVVAATVSTVNRKSVT